MTHFIACAWRAMRRSSSEKEDGDGDNDDVDDKFGDRDERGCGRHDEVECSEEYDEQEEPDILGSMSGRLANLPSLF